MFKAFFEREKRLVSEKLDLLLAQQLSAHVAEKLEIKLVIRIIQVVVAVGLGIRLKNQFSVW